MLLDIEEGDRKMQPTKLNIVSESTLLPSCMNHGRILQTKGTHQLVRDARPGDHLVFHCELLLPPFSDPPSSRWSLDSTHRLLRAY